MTDTTPTTPADETEEQRLDREQTERAHAEGEHAFCGVTCEATFPSDMLRNGILCRAVPGSAAMLDELLRRAARLLLGTTDQQPETTTVDRRARYAAAMALRDGHPEWPVRYEDDERDYLRRADAVMAVADAEVVQAMRAMHDTKEEEREAHRLALSEALGLGTGAPWDVIRDRAAELHTEFERRTLMLQASRDQVAKLGTTITRLRAERAELGRQLDRIRGDMRDMEAHVREQDAEFERLRRLADEAQQPETEAAPSDTSPVQGVPGVPPTATVYLSSPCDACRHTLNWHRNDVGCTVALCVCGQFQFQPAAVQPDTETEAQQ